MLKIRTTGVEDYLDGSANIKALIIGGPGAGKTRSSSFWPKPLYLDCENGRGSLADRKMPYVEIKCSRDMLDALEFLKSLEHTPKAQRQFHTIVVDTADSFSRVVKDEWLQQSGAAAFSGFEAWGFLDAKMQMLFTRLLNLDYNVLVLCHYKDKTFKDGENNVREFTLQLQGQIAEQVFNDFGLVGFLGTYWEAEDGQRVQRRGLTFNPSPDKPFLKDRFNVTPKWLPITFTEDDYNQIFEAFFNRPEFEALPEAASVGEIPSADVAPILSGRVAAPVEGGALPPAAPAAPADVPLERKMKADLEKIATGLGLPFKGNTLKGELIAMIKAAQSGEAPQTSGAEAAPEEPETSSVETPTASAPEPAQEPAAEATPLTSGDVAHARANGGVLPEPEPTPAPEAHAPEEMTAEQVAQALGGDVISEEIADTPATQSAPPPPPVVTPTSAPRGPSACADCAKDLGEEWNDPTKKDYIRLSFVKHRRYLCTGCLQAAS